MKKILAIAVALCVTISVSGCSNQAEITGLSFSEYYKGADEFDIIRPYLEEYFSYVRSAYEGSNEKDVESFVLADGYENAENALAEFSQNDSDLSETGEALEGHLAKLQLLEPYLRIEAMLGEREVLLSASSHVENEDWFQQLNSLIWDSIDEYRRGTGD